MTQIDTDLLKFYVFQDMAIWIVKNKRKTDNPITAEAVCGFAMFPQCELKGDHFTWTLDLEFAGPKPALLEEAVPAVKHY
jgi:hypothetical protein